MTGKQRVVHAIEHKTPIHGEHVPHFEMVFYLTVEALGMVHPTHCFYAQWDQFSKSEKELHRANHAECYLKTARLYNHDAIFVHPNPYTHEETVRLLEIIRERSGDEFFLLLHGDPTYAIPSGADMIEFAVAFAEEPEKMKQKANQLVDQYICNAEKISHYKGLLDGFAMCSDYCFNAAPFFSPGQFADFVTPYLTRIIQAYKDIGYYTFKHTDGNIMTILDQLVQAGPHVLHSLDPQAGVDLKTIKKICGRQICLMGNVNCGLLQTGTDEEVRSDVRRAIRDGMCDGGFILSTSNCIYSGLPLERYELMHKTWREDGIYT